MICLPDGDEVLNREKHMIQSPKLMLTFIWNPHGFQVVDVMPKREMFTAACYIRISEYSNIGNILSENVARRGER
jgi:hypothetical protein